MIIPDDELTYLPFEILSDSGKIRLVTRYAVTYNYSCSLLNRETDKIKTFPVLAMAPFVKELPASEMEIDKIRGEKVTGRNATKQRFVTAASNFPVLHLATHARANDSLPARSYIEFYPTDSSFTSSRLFTNEISLLGLNEVNLVILSACETGAGQLVKGEGLMSITRAFSYAGCRNTIASLWKADDVSTAKISRSMHRHINDGKSFAIALQLAKNDYIEQAAGRLKLPAYWAHLRLVGNFQASAPNRNIYFLVGAGVLVLLALVIFLSRRQF
jgi:CHAT domain-containing protein